MKTSILNFSILSIVIFTSTIFLVSGCASTPPLKNQPQQTMKNFKNYERKIVYASNPPWTNTEIKVQEGDIIIFLASGSVNTSSTRRNVPPPTRLYYRIGDDSFPRNALYSTYGARYNQETKTALTSGRLKLTVKDWNSSGIINHRYYNDNSGSFTVDIFVIDKDKEDIIPDLLRELSKSNIEDQVFKDNVEQFVERNKLYYATKKTEKEISITKNEIDNLKENIKTSEKTEKKTTPLEKNEPPNTKVATKKQTPLQKSHEIEKNEQVVQLGEKLTKLTETLAQMEILQKKYEEQRQKTELLSKELADKDLKEKMLLTKLEGSSKMPPIIVVASPKNHSEVEFGFVNLSGVTEDEKGLQQLEILINGKLLTKGDDRGVAVTNIEAPKRLEFKERILLEEGVNQLIIRAVDSDGLISERMLIVQYTKKRKNIWAVVIGIDKYPKVRQLKYAVNDSRSFYDYLVGRNFIPAENVTLLLDQDATLQKIKSVLGTTLKNKAGKDDMVIIYFAGHGATEKDTFSPDGDGLEKYLLPFNADLNDLYSTALPMGELSKIFNRISSERLIYIADAC